MYKRAIVILKNSQLCHIVRNVLHNRRKEYEEELEFLTDFSRVRREIAENRKTAGIREQLHAFIGKHGFPFALVLDYRADLGLPVQLDPDSQMLFRAFLLMFSILHHNPRFKNKIMNLICVADEKDSEEVRKCAREPGLLLRGIRTRDERTNRFLAGFTADAERIRRFFNIHHVVRTGQNGFAEEVRQLEEAMNSLEQSIARQTSGNGQETRAAEHLIHENLPPASVICRPSPEKVIRNGEIRDIAAEEKQRLKENMLYIQGAITHSTVHEVQQRIVRTFDAVLKVKPFKKDAEVVLLVPDSSVIDGGFAMNMGVFISNSLARSYRIRVDMGKVNHEKVKTSSGYIAIKDFLGKAV